MACINRSPITPVVLASTDMPSCFTAHVPQITFRRDPSNYRPRINKMDSVKDREQKTTGNFFFMESDDS